MSEQKPRYKKKPAVRKEYPIPPAGRISLSLAEVCGLTGIGMTKIREAIEAGLLPARRLGKKIVVRRPDVDGFLTRLPSGTKAAQKSAAET